MSTRYTRRDDERLDNRFAIEQRRGYANTGYREFYVIEDAEDPRPGILKIDTCHLPAFFDAVDVLRALHAKEELRPPTPAKLAQWDREEEEQLLAKRYENEDPATLRHAADLLEKRAAKRKLEKHTAKNSQRRTP